MRVMGPEVSHDEADKLLLNGSATRSFSSLQPQTRTRMQMSNIQVDAMVAATTAATTKPGTKYCLAAASCMNHGSMTLFSAPGQILSSPFPIFSSTPLPHRPALSSRLPKWASVL